MTDLTQNLNKLLIQAEDSIKYQTSLSLQNLNTFLPDMERITFDVTPLDIYYCVKLKEETLKTATKIKTSTRINFAFLCISCSYIIIEIRKTFSRWLKPIFF